MEGRQESEECGHEGCSRGDFGQREVETDRKTSSSANLTDEKQEEVSVWTLGLTLLRLAISLEGICLCPTCPTFVGRVLHLSQGQSESSAAYVGLPQYPVLQLRKRRSPSLSLSLSLSVESLKLIAWTSTSTLRQQQTYEYYTRALTANSWML